MRHRPICVWVIGAAILLLPRLGGASCNVIPSATGTFRSALGAPLRPFAAPGEAVELRVRPDVCDANSSGFSATAADNVVTVVFTPPGSALRNVVVLAANCGALASQVTTCGMRPDVDTATCVPVDPTLDPGSLAVFTRNGETEPRLSFRFPNTDALLAPDGDQRTLTGPATIAVTNAMNPLPCGLASAPCRSTPGTIACVDELYDIDGTCRVGTAFVNDTFGHFTALPVPNDYAAVCTDPMSLCSASQNHIRFTVDAAGNVLFPVDWRGVLVAAPNPPVPRLLRASTSLPAFGTGSPIRIPSRAFLGSYTPEGIILPPIFEPQFDPSASSELVMFGSADAPYTILRAARRGPELKACSGGGNNGRPCATSDDCPSGTCTTATCVGGATPPNTPCTGDDQCPGGECGPALFNLGGLMQAGVGPIVLPRAASSGVCESGAESGDQCPPATCPGSSCVAFRARAGEPVPLDSLLSSDQLFAYSSSEPLAGHDLNGDGDALDTSVATVLDRTTGEYEGQCSTDLLPCTNDAGCASPQTCVPIQRGTTRQYPRCPDPLFGSPPALSAEGDLVAFLEPEDTGINADGNMDGDRADALVRVFDFARTSANPEVTAGSGIVADSSQTVNGRGIAVSGGFVFYRHSERGQVSHVTDRVSLGSLVGGPSGPSGILGRIAISDDGRYVAFTSEANDIVGDDTNGVADVFVYDRTLGTTERVSVDSDEVEGDGASSNPSIAYDGRSVAFESDATNLVASDTNGATDVFVRNLITGTTERMSLTTSGGQANGPSFNAAMWLGDVAFASLATNLVANDTNGVADVFVRFDAQPGLMTTRVSEGPGSFGNFQQSNGPSGLDGVEVNRALIGSVNFTTEAGNLVYSPPPLGVPYLTTGYYSNVGAYLPALSSVGWGPTTSVTRDFDVGFCAQKVFASESDLGGDANGVADVFVSSANTGTVNGPVSVTSAGVPANGPSVTPSAALKTPWIAFASSATNLAVDPSVGDDVFLHDLAIGSTVRVSGGASGVAGNGASDHPVLSADGTTVAFRSDATDLVPGDTNGFSDVFVYGPNGMDPAGDITGDGRVDDVVLERYDPATGTATPICPAGTVAVAAGAAAFLRSLFYSEATPALPGCPDVGSFPGPGGSTTTTGEAYLALPSGTVENLGQPVRGDIAIGAVCSGGSEPGAGCDSDAECDGGVCNPTWVGASVGEDANDLNNDGDYQDAVLLMHAVGAAPSVWLNSMQATEAGGGDVQVQGSIAAFKAVEFNQGIYTDLNNDGDNTDVVQQVYDASTSTLTNLARNSALQQDLGRPEWIDCGSGPQLRQLLAFAVDEIAENPGSTLNGPGDTDASDNVLFVYDLTAQTLTNVGKSVVPCVVPGCTTNAAFRVGHHQVKFLTYEPYEGDNGGTDLNNDGDKTDTVIQLYNACTGAVKFIGTPGGGGDPLAPPREPGDGSAYGGPGGRCINGMTVLLSPGSCATNADCPPGSTCSPGNISIGSGDEDGDGIPNATDNCPSLANDQIDADADGVGDACDAAICGNGMTDPGETCDDGNATAGDGCSTGCLVESGCTLQPMEGCRRPTEPAKSLLILKDNPANERDLVLWRWMKGAATDKTDFGTPLASTSYALCVYDETGGLATRVLARRAPGGGTCGTAPCWKDLRTGFKYTDTELTPHGILQVRLKAGDDGKASIKVKGKGANLAPPVPPLFQDPQVVVQLQNGTTDCWEATYGAAIRNVGGLFKAKSD